MPDGQMGRLELDVSCVRRREAQVEMTILEVKRIRNAPKVLHDETPAKSAT